MNTNSETLYYVHQHIIPVALSYLPGQMTSPQARAMLLAIGLQESKFGARVQGGGGPAHGFWQFESGGAVKGVLKHPHTSVLLQPVLDVLQYPADVTACYNAIVHNDVLACIFARLLLWTVPGALPVVGQSEKGWQQYLDGWQPGKPHPKDWPKNFAEGWQTVLHA